MNYPPYSHYELFTMNYSLGDRFQGAFWGVTIAHQLTSSQIPKYPFESDRQAITQGIEWIYQSACNPIPKGEPPHKRWIHLPGQQSLIALLPLWLYNGSQSLGISPHFHHIPLPPSTDHYNEEVSPLTLGQFSDIITSVLTQLLQPSLSVANLMNALEASCSSVIPTNKPLQSFRNRLHHPTSLSAIIDELNTDTVLPPAILALLLGLYYSISLQSQARLALKRACFNSPSPQLTTLLTAIILGASQGSYCFPCAWKYNNSLGRNWQNLTTRLMAIWSGVYQVEVESLRLLSGG